MSVAKPKPPEIAGDGIHGVAGGALAARMMPGGTSAAEWPAVDGELDTADYEPVEPIAPLVRPAPVADPAAA